MDWISRIQEKGQQSAGQKILWSLQKALSTRDGLKAISQHLDGQENLEPTLHAAKKLIEGSLNDKQLKEIAKSTGVAGGVLVLLIAYLMMRGAKSNGPKQ
jgi:lipopolysaccharide biosynthesis regulator YciM